MLKKISTLDSKYFPLKSSSTEKMRSVFKSLKPFSLVSLDPRKLMIAISS